MASSGDQGSSFGILGSSKLNTQDAKNPPQALSDALKAATNIGSGQGSDASKGEAYRRECQRAHDEMEARLKDEELQGRSRGWSD